MAAKLSLPLLLIFQTSSNKGVILNERKQTNVVQIFKGKGSKHIIDNYRPISLTYTSCKVIESIIHKNIVDYCDRNNILTDEQHGFRNKHSTTTNLLEFMDDITSFVDNTHSVDIIIIDFAKAFDTISYNKLLYKLQTYGVCGKVKLWIKEFLLNRSFKVTLNNTSFKEYIVTSSVSVCIYYASYQRKHFQNE